MELSLSLLGETEVRLDNKLLENLSAEKACALLFYLVVESHHAHRRDALAEMFWPEKPQGYGRNSLKQNLSLLRSALGDRELEEPFLLTSNRDLQFNTGSNFQVDLLEFEDLSRKARQHCQNTEETCEKCAALLNQAAGLYRDDFLNGFYLSDSPDFNEWVLTKRESCKRQMGEILGRLISCLETKGEYKAAARYAEQLVSLEPWSEISHRQLMRLLATSGKRSAALKQYHNCEAMLANEFGVQPTPETKRLFEAIKKWDQQVDGSTAEFKSPKSDNAVDIVDVAQSPGIRGWVRISVSLSFLVLVGMIYILFGQNWLEGDFVVQPDHNLASPSETDSGAEQVQLLTPDLNTSEGGSGSISNNLPDPNSPPESTAPVIDFSESDYPSSTYPDLACLPGEELLYLEDFQDGQAQGWQEIEYQAQDWEIINDPGTPGNLILTRPSTFEGYSDLRDHEFDNAVWRLKIMHPAKTISTFTWKWQERYYASEKGMVDFSGYPIWIHFPGVHVNRIEEPYSDLALRWEHNTLRLNTWHNFEISTFEGKYEVWIDGISFVEYQDPTPLPPGRLVIGVGMEGEPENHTQVYFDDFIVCGLSDPFVSMYSDP